MKNKIYTLIILLVYSLAAMGQAPNWQWVKSAGGATNDYTKSMAVDVNGNSYITGYFDSDSITFGTTTLSNAGTGSDIFIAKYDASGNNSFYTLNIFPNPVLNKLNITVMNNSLSEIIIYDIVSKKMLQKKFINTLSLNTEQLAKGIYLYEVRNKNGVIKKGKIVKSACR